MSARVLLRAAYCNLYFDSHRHSVQFGHTFRRGLHNVLCMKKVNWGYQYDDQSKSLIPKWDPGITNFSIPNPGIDNSIPGLQSHTESQQ